MAAPLNILCIDDDREILTIIELALGLDPAIAIRTAGDSSEALAILGHRDWTPDCILTDARMPGRSGKLLIGEIRYMPRFEATPVIFLTASTTSREIAEFLDLGARGVITKPFDPILLAADVRRLIET